MSLPLIDIGINLEHASYDPDRAAVIERARAAGIVAMIVTGSTLAHMNFVGDSVIGRDVNFEAGSIVANSGALLAARTVVPRLALVDQELGARNA